MVPQDIPSRARLPVAYHDDDLTLYRVGGDHPAGVPGRGVVLMPRHLVWLGDCSMLGAVGTSPSSACMSRAERDVR